MRPTRKVVRRLQRFCLGLDSRNNFNILPSNSQQKDTRLPIRIGGRNFMSISRTGHPGSKPPVLTRRHLTSPVTLQALPLTSCRVMRASAYRQAKTPMRQTASGPLQRRRLGAPRPVQTDPGLPQAARSDPPPRTDVHAANQTPTNCSLLDFPCKLRRSSVPEQYRFRRLTGELTGREAQRLERWSEDEPSPAGFGWACMVSPQISVRSGAVKLRPHRRSAFRLPPATDHATRAL